MGKNGNFCLLSIKNQVHYYGLFHSLEYILYYKHEINMMYRCDEVVLNFSLQFVFLKKRHSNDMNTRHLTGLGIFRCRPPSVHFSGTVEGAFLQHDTSRKIF